MYINTETKETTYKISISNTSLPRIPSAGLIAELGYAEVVLEDRPPDLNGRVITEGAITENNGVYTQTWTIDDSGVDPMRDLRIARDALLRDSDWTHASDSTEVLGAKCKTAWATYRQDLRDLPASYVDNPEDIVYPQPPGASGTPNSPCGD